ncbi:MAG: hypothetical protein IMW92_00885 [Bacillales bacterium]|nr:hypothetical protein [Bacillales bacterium]
MDRILALWLKKPVWPFMKEHQDPKGAALSAAPFEFNVFQPVRLESANLIKRSESQRQTLKGG